MAVARTQRRASPQLTPTLGHFAHLRGHWANTRRAYASDWRHYSAWTRRHTFPALPPDPQVLGLYIAACASRAITGKPDSAATLARRISALRWNFAQRGEKFDRADRHVATVLAGVRRTQGRPPEQKEAILPEDLKA